MLHREKRALYITVQVKGLLLAHRPIAPSSSPVLGLTFKAYRTSVEQRKKLN
jgi:hypothetical protein